MWSWRWLWRNKHWTHVSDVHSAWQTGTITKIGMDNAKLGRALELSFEPSKQTQHCDKTAEKKCWHTKPWQNTVSNDMRRRNKNSDLSVRQLKLLADLRCLVCWQCSACFLFLQCLASLFQSQPFSLPFSLPFRLDLSAPLPRLCLLRSLVCCLPKK